MAREADVQALTQGDEGHQGVEESISRREWLAGRSTVQEWDSLWGIGDLSHSEMSTQGKM